MTKGERQPVILVVDDIDDFRVELREALEQLGARVEEAGNTEKALKIMASHDAKGSSPIDLVVLDMRMPMSAGDVSTNYRAGIATLAGYRLVRCPIIVFTAYPSYGNCVEAIKAGAYAYLPKSPQETDTGIEGGMEDLVNLCKRLLFGPEPAHVQESPSDEWYDTHYQWLTDAYAGKWVAFVTESAAREADLKGEQLAIRDGIAVLSGDSYEDVRNVVISSPPLFGEGPMILMVPPRSQ